MDLAGDLSIESANITAFEKKLQKAVRFKFLSDVIIEPQLKLVCGFKCTSLNLKLRQRQLINAVVGCALCRAEKLSRNFRLQHTHLYIHVHTYILVLLDRVSNTNISFEMDLPWISIFVGALASTTALTQLAPSLSGYKTPISPIPTLFLLFFALLILAFIWKAILYPKLFSSIRHLPGPSVSRKLCTNAQIFLIGFQGRLLSQWPFPCHQRRLVRIPFPEMDQRDTQRRPDLLQICIQFGTTSYNQPERSGRSTSS